MRSLQRLVVQGRVLARRGDAHGVFQAHRLAPFLGRPRAAVIADLVDAPVEFEVMAVGIQELDRDLAAGAAAALEDDLGAVLLQVIAGAEHLVERGELEGEVMQRLLGLAAAGSAADQRQAMVIAVAAQEHHAARHHVAGIDVGDPEAQHLGVEALGRFEVGDIDHGVADLLDGEGRVHGFRLPCRNQVKASSRRSSPQKSSPATAKVGEPNNKRGWATFPVRCSAIMDPNDASGGRRMARAPNRLSASEAVLRMAQKRLKARDLVEACLDRIEAREGQVHAWEALDPDGARKRADMLDKRSRPAGPLHGIPLAVKDIISTRTMPTTCGSPIYRDHVVGKDAACVTQLVKAGAIVLGKAVTTEFAGGHAGKTHNPHNLRHTPAGSSSGSAAAVADFMAPVGYGTQTAGSVIRPGAFNGVVAYKGSYGWADMTRHQGLCAQPRHAGLLRPRGQ